MVCIHVPNIMGPNHGGPHHGCGRGVDQQGTHCSDFRRRCSDFRPHTRYGSPGERFRGLSRGETSSKWSGEKGLSGFG